MPDVDAENLEFRSVGSFRSPQSIATRDARLQGAGLCVLLLATMTTPAEHSEPPPALTEPINSVELDSIKDGKISTVSVYNGRAEVTRIFQFEVNTGQNLVHISGLPTVLDVDSFRYVLDDKPSCCGC